MLVKNNQVPSFFLRPTVSRSVKAAGGPLLGPAGFRNAVANATRSPVDAGAAGHRRHRLCSETSRGHVAAPRRRLQPFFALLIELEDVPAFRLMPTLSVRT